MKKKLGLLLCTITQCSSAISAQEKPHSIFINAGTGTVEAESRGDINVIMQLGYLYQLDESLSIDIRNTRSEASGFGNFFIADLDFSLNTVSGQYRKNLGGHHFTYISIGASYYDWEYTDKMFTGKVVNKADDTGVDLYYAVGYKYEFSDIELGAEYQVINMGDMDSKIFSINLGYRF